MDAILYCNHYSMGQTGSGQLSQKSSRCYQIIPSGMGYPNVMGSMYSLGSIVWLGKARHHIESV